MRLTFAFPSSGEETGGVMTLYLFANALSRRGHDVTFVHGPAWPTLITSLDQLPDVCRRDGVQHLIAQRLDDVAVPASDIVFTHSAPAALGKPCIFVQGYGLLSPEWEDEAFRQRAPKICVAEWLVDIGRSLGVAAEELFCVNYGIDHSLFTLRTPLDERPLDVAALSHPHPEKGWPVLLDTLERLSAARPGFRGAVFGRNPPKGVLPTGVEFVHSPNHEQLARDVYGKTRVFIQASHREGFGLTPVEAMACGAALVTTDNGGSRDYAIDDVTARVVPPGDAALLAAAAESLLDHDDERCRLARAGMSHVARFDWDVAGQRIEEILVDYLDNPERFS